MTSQLTPDTKRSRSLPVLLTLGLCLIHIAARGDMNVPQFTGDDSYVNIGNVVELTLASDAPLTVEAWMYLNVVSGGSGGRDMLYSHSDGRTTGSGRYTLMLGVYQGGRIAAYTGDAWREPSPTYAIPGGEWVHLAFSFDGSTMTYFVNGESVGTSTFNFTQRSGHTVKLGGYHASSDINGMKSDVRFWNHARDQEQIEALMYRRLTGNEPGLLGYWPLNEGEGDIVHDLSPHGNDGTLIGAGWTTTSDLDLLSFAVAHPVTGSTRFTNTNTVDIIGFGAPAGYTHYLITETDDPPQAGWLTTNPPPETYTFSLPATDGPVWLYLWYTNTNASVELISQSNHIVYTTAAPEPVALSRMTVETAIGGRTVTVKASDIDAGSTGGESGGEEIGIQRMTLTCLTHPDCDAVPFDDTSLTLPPHAGGHYHHKLTLTVINQAGTSATAAETCSLDVLPVVVAEELFDGLENARIDWPERWNIRWPEQWNIERTGGSDMPWPTLGTGFGRHNQHQRIIYSIGHVDEVNARLRTDFRFSTGSTIGPNARFYVRYQPEESGQRRGYFARVNANSGHNQLFIMRVVGGSEVELGRADDVWGDGFSSRSAWHTMIVEAEQTSSTQTTVRAKLWRSADGEPEPEEWTLTVVDDHEAMQNLDGAVAVFGHTTGNRRWDWRNLRATRIPFIIADPITFSSSWTRTNTVAVTAFAPPEGYDQYRITETDVPPTDGWEPITSPPATATFATPASDGRVTLYAWFTNQTESVPPHRYAVDIAYATAPPEPLMPATIEHEIVDNAVVVVTGADLDAGSTGGMFEGETIPLYAWVAVCDTPGADATPDEPYVTLTAPGTYHLRLTLTNAAGSAATAAATCTVIVSEAVTATADRYVIKNNPEAASPYGTWATAAPDIQTAIDAAAPGETILVWKGVYDQGGRPAADSTLTNRVTLDKAVTVRAASADPARTVIRGRRHQPMASVTQPIDYEIQSEILGNAAVRCAYLVSGAQLHGFTLADGATRNVTGNDGRGGGVWCAGADAVISNCVIVANVARDSGGGVYGGTLSESTIVSNRSLGSGGGASAAVLWHSTVADNAADSLGGGVTDSTVHRSTLRGNRDRTNGAGGGGANNSQVYHSIVTGNRGGLRGGGLRGGSAYSSLITGNWTQWDTAHGGGASEVALTNCTVAFNRSATFGGGIHAGHALNCIVYDNSARLTNETDSLNYSAATDTTFEFSCTTPVPGTWAENNIDQPPRFLEPGSGYREDYVTGDYQLHQQSPAIDAGLNQAWMTDPGDVRSRDLQGVRRIQPHGGIVDMGAYERVWFGSLFFIR